jgi:hypothetical protein
MAAYFEQGKYKVRIEAQSLGENSKGNPELQLRLKILGYYEKNEFCEIDAEYPRTVYLVLTDATIGTSDKPGWVLQVLRALNFNGTSFAQLDPEHKDAVSFVGLEVDARCDHETWQGKEREKWSILRDGGGSTKARKPLEKKSLRALDAKFSKLLKATRPEPALAGVGAGDLDPPPPGRSDEEIPF